LSWSGKTVLVTGAGGFIGSHLAERLVEVGAKIRALVHYRADSSSGWLEKSPCRDEMEIVAGDVRDSESVLRAARGVDVIFHLAALIGIPYSYHAPVSYVRTNIEGTLNILVAARDLNVERVVHTSTSEVYGTARYVPISELHPLQAQSPYAASKIGADKLAEAFFHSFGLPVVILRPFNTFGPRQSARAVIPAIITQCLTLPRIRLGNIHPTRDFNFVSNTVDGYLRAAAAPEAVGRTINIGSGREVSIEELAKTIAENVGRAVTIEFDKERVRPKDSEVERLVADSSEAQKILGWQPSVSLEKGLQVTIDWLRKHLDAYRPTSYAV